MTAVATRVKVPPTAVAGEVVTIKTLASHPMETGHRRAQDGALIPRRIIRRFAARFNGRLVVAVDMAPVVSANPYFLFDMIVPESGVLAFEWIEDDGTVHTEERTIAVA